MSSKTPTQADILSVIPPHCHQLDFIRSAGSTLMSLGLTAVLAVTGHTLLPAPTTCPLAIAAWTGYAIVTGTVAFGLWVIGHECGHQAFCTTPWVGDLVGYILHSAMLLPYFTWRRSHAVHHAHTNHIFDGETHVPRVFGTWFGTFLHHLQHFLGNSMFGIIQIFAYLGPGWSAYLWVGTSGSPTRDQGVSNHYLAWGPQLFPRRAWTRYLASNCGVGAMVVLLYRWASARGSTEVVCLYGGPLIVVNAWLVMVTWLQHTDVHVPHLDSSVWTWARGASQTVDRPYHWILDLLHHRVGTTHGMHHRVPTIPHYHAHEATAALQTAFPGHFQMDPTPVLAALWRVASRCAVTYAQGDGTYTFTPAARKRTT